MMLDMFYWEGISKDPKKILKFIEMECPESIYCVDLEKEELKDDEVLFMLNDLCKKFNYYMSKKRRMNYNYCN